MKKVLESFKEFEIKNSYCAKIIGGIGIAQECEIANETYTNCTNGSQNGNCSDSTSVFSYDNGTVISTTTTSTCCTTNL